MLQWIKTGLIWCGLVLSFYTYAQEIPLGALPMQYNGSFAGETGGARFSSNIGYSRFGEDFYNQRIFSSSISYDQFIPQIGTGLGLIANINKYKFTMPWGGRNSETKSQGLTIVAAPKISIKGKYTLSPSIDFTYGAYNYKVNYNYLFDTTLVDTNEKSSGVNSKVGLLFNTNKYYIGYSMYIFKQSPNHDFSIRRDFQAYIQMGYTFQRSCESTFSFTPQVVFEIVRHAHENKTFFNVEAYNLNFRYKKYIWGVNNTGIHLGWQTEKIRVMLTNDVGIFNEYTSGNGYSGNLSLRYIIKGRSQ